MKLRNRNKKDPTVACASCAIRRDQHNTRVPCPRFVEPVKQDVVIPVPKVFHQAFDDLLGNLPSSLFYLPRTSNRAGVKKWLGVIGDGAPVDTTPITKDALDQRLNEVF